MTLPVEVKLARTMTTDAVDDYRRRLLATLERMAVEHRSKPLTVKRHHYAEAFGLVAGIVQRGEP